MPKRHKSNAVQTSGRITAIHLGDRVVECNFPFYRGDVISFDYYFDKPGAIKDRPAKPADSGLIIPHDGTGTIE